MPPLDPTDHLRRPWRVHGSAYVRPRGGLGRIYLRIIEPFRRLLVYPDLLRAGWRRPGDWPRG